MSEIFGLEIRGVIPALEELVGVYAVQQAQVATYFRESPLFNRYPVHHYSVLVRGVRDVTFSLSRKILTVTFAFTGVRLDYVRVPSATLAVCRGKKHYQ